MAYKSDPESDSPKITYGEHVLCRLPERYPSLEAGEIKLDGVEADEITIKNVNDHFQHFCSPVGKAGECIKCGTPQGGMFGAFRWGLAHGSGICSGCSWPAVAYHFVKDSSGKGHRIDMILQLHPDNVTKGEN